MKRMTALFFAVLLSAGLLTANTHAQQDPVAGDPADDAPESTEQADPAAQSADPEMQAEPETPAENDGFAGGMDPMPNGHRGAAQSDDQDDGNIPDDQE